MFDLEEMNKLCKKKRYNKSTLAEAMGVSKQLLHCKFIGKARWNIDDLSRLKNAEFTDKEICQIFLKK